MSSIRPRRWRSPDGEIKSAWVVDYFDQHHKRHIKTFARKRDAEGWRAQVAVDVRAGTHSADSGSISVTQAGGLWLQNRTAAGLEPTSLVTYRVHVERHITPRIGATKLSQLTVPAARAFEDRLRLDCSSGQTRAILRSLGAILADSQERGLVAQSVVRSLRRHRHRGSEHRHDKRHKGKLKVGVDIPSPDEIRAGVAALARFPRWRPLLLTAIFTGLRSSELRGLRWSDIDFKRGEVHVRQRADGLNKIGRPKSAAGERTVTLPPMVVRALQEWKLACPRSELGLALPTARGNVQTRKQIAKLGLGPAQIAAGVTAVKLDRAGKPTRVVAAKYPGMHSLRHFYASWCINRKVDGGCELSPKIVQERMGHATITLTMDTYGHLFPRGDDGAELAAAEKAFLAG